AGAGRVRQVPELEARRRGHVMTAGPPDDGGSGWPAGAVAGGPGGPAPATERGRCLAGGLMTPSPSLLGSLRAELMRRPPFSRMRPEDVEALVAGASQTYHAPGELIVGPASGVVDCLFYVRSGSVLHRPTGEQAADFQFEAGDVFPLGAMMAQRAVTGTHIANAD